ncbi:ChuX/HutX family heme-like substrate-binding protein [Snodgrassella sp. CFCC 13594]|uniref:ChuX/HutX family heme-like substrate-binding protein n=1 Tax=Snodgrassella sp. CFCC 13594 TaxID=1775559 RepID=UPI000830EF6F|nr:ChuX/HutX family heme-like substrate-binding protein [Snodgrassella sp. CFCC 13594]
MNLWQQYLSNKDAAQGPYFTREGAADLGISEGELIAQAPDTIYLGGAIRDIILKLDTLGLVQSVVRNSVAVHEKTALYENVTLSPVSGLAINVGGMDLRFFPQRWHHALAVTAHQADKVTRSIQFYDEFGVALEKVFMRDDTKLPEWTALVDAFRTEGLPEFEQGTLPPVAVPEPLSAERAVAFQERWLELKDVHHFGGLLETFGIDRQSAYRYAPQGYTKALDNTVWEEVLTRVRDSGMELMIFCGNRGLVQIQTGAVHHVVRARGYLNILDGQTEGFNLHLKDSDIVETWVVRRPVRDGYVTCIEGFDERRKSVIQFFGRRQEGETELNEWQRITNQLLGVA